MHLPALLSAALGLAALAAARPEWSGPHTPGLARRQLEYHAHSSFFRNGTALTKRASSTASCPSREGPLLAQYVPAWTSGATAGVDWDSTDMAFWFCTLTSADGIALAPGMTVGAMQQFVSAPTAAGRLPLLTIGGWSGSVYFSSLVSTASSRASFAATIKTWLTQYGFGGVDLDWEFVGRQGEGSNIVSSADAASYLLFLKALREALGTDKVITAAVPASGFTGADGKIMTDTSAFAQYFDYIILMAYDFYGAWSATTGPNAPLYTCNSGSDSVDDTVTRWRAQGWPACKLLLGIPAYSHRFSTASSTLASTIYNGKKTTAFQQPGSVAVSDPGTGIKGLISEGVLKSDLSAGAGGYTRYWDDCTKTPFLFSPTDRTFITYDDDESWAAKAAYADNKGLAGLAIYESTGHTPAMLAAAVDGIGRVSAPASSSSSSSSSSRTTTTTTSASRTTTTSAAQATVTKCSLSNDCAGNSRPANSNAYCSSGTCSWRCRSGFTSTGSACLAPGQTTTTTTSPARTTTTTTSTRTTTTTAAAATRTCAASNDCSGLAIPDFANNYCSKGVCSWSCRSGYISTGSACVKPGATSSTTTSAAATSQTCAASSQCTGTIPGNANHYCNKGVCSWRCRSGYTSTGTACTKSAKLRLARTKRAEPIDEEDIGLYEGLLAGAWSRA
ncbi:hypothetical protein JCM10207_004827 [Rhodosporidiobolus poonsookiae]